MRVSPSGGKKALRTVAIAHFVFGVDFAGRGRMKLQGLVALDPEAYQKEAPLKG